MPRLILLVLAVGLFAWWWRGRSAGRPPEAQAGTAAPPVQQSDALVTCAHCQVQLPSSDALSDGSCHHYCCEAHRQAGSHSSGT